MEIGRRNPDFIGNRERKEHVEGAEEVLDGMQELPGTKTLNEVKKRLTEMRKNKEQLEAKLHFYESKLENSVPRMASHVQNP